MVHNDLRFKKQPFSLLKLIPAIGGLLKQYEKALWWVHSTYALLFGVGMMWLGRRNFTFLRGAVLYILLIWATSLILPSSSQYSMVSSPWSRKLHFIVNYFQKNSYQQLIFFVLPIYYASSTIRSRQVLFLIALVVSGVLSTLDLVYDKFLSRRSSYFAVFFAFNLFACINLFLPVLLRISNTRALQISALLALIGFTSVSFRWTSLSRGRNWKVIAGGGILLFLIIELGRPFIPPSPLRLVSVIVGGTIDPQSLEVTTPMVSIPAGFNGKVYGLTAIRAPSGLNERVRHEWRVDGEKVSVSPFHLISGGRQQGYRLWTGCSLKNPARGEKLELDVKTEGGQLIGCVVIPVE